jgi:hypothetical protein
VAVAGQPGGRHPPESASSAVLGLAAQGRTTSVPCTSVSMVQVGLFTISRTPTAAVRWNTASHLSTNALSWTLPIIYPNREWARRWRMLSMLPVDRSSSAWTSSPRAI